MSEVSTERAKLGYGLGEDEGEAFWLFGMLETIKIGRDDTAGAYGLVDIVAPRGTVALARPSRRERVVLRPRWRADLLCRRFSSVHARRFVCVRSYSSVQCSDIGPPLVAASEASVRGVPKPPALCLKASIAGVGQLH